MSAAIDALLALLPDGVEVATLRELVASDLVPEDGVIDLIGRNVSDDDPIVRREALPRIRPILVALAARAAGAHSVDGETQYAAELLHLALVVHDLALGREGGKRRRVARRLLKRSVSWLSGNHLTLRALELTRAANPNVRDAVLDTLREFADGQALSRELLDGELPSREDWVEHANHHTGALFAFCCRAGGHLADADDRTRYALRRYGRHLGRLWHAAEDASALRHGDAGRHLLTRALAGRPVLAVICAAEIDPEIGPLWSRLVTDPDLVVAEQLAGRVLAAGGVAMAAEVMTSEAWAARKVIRRLPDSTYREALDRLAERLARAGLRRA